MGIERNTPFIVFRQSPKPLFDPAINNAPPGRLEDYLRQQQCERQQRMLNSGLAFQQAQLEAAKFRKAQIETSEEIEIDRLTNYMSFVTAWLNINKFSAKKRSLSIRFIQSEVEEYFHINHDDLMSDNRIRVLVRPRQIAMFISRKIRRKASDGKSYLYFSTTNIGTAFRRDHTTVLHACHKISCQIGDPQFLWNLGKFYKFDQETYDDVANLLARIGYPSYQDQ